MTQASVEQTMETALAHHQAGRLEEAAALYRLVLQRQKDHTDALHFLGLTELQLGRIDSAAELMARAVALEPDVAEFHSNLGLALQSAGKLPEAAAELHRAVELDGEYLEAYQNLAGVCQKLNRMDECAAAWQRVTELVPTSAEAHNNLGNALLASGRPELAAAALRRAALLRPADPKSLTNLGAALLAAGKVDEARDTYRQALKSHPDFAPAHFNHAMVLLLTGDYEAGWKEYEWRWELDRFKAIPRPSYGSPWDGGDLSGRRTLLYAEQGWGDAIQFFRHAGEVAARGGDVVVRVPSALVRLLYDSSDLKIISSDSSPPDCELHAPLMSLPLLLGRVETKFPYLRADPARAAAWKERFSGISELKCGIVWAGNPIHPDDRVRSIPIETLAPLADAPGIRFISLQKGIKSPPWMLNMADELTDFADTAAAIANLDLVISVDTAVAHLAGAMARPVWNLIAFAPDWRWMLQSPTTSWYPTMRLFRQDRIADWPGVVDRIKTELSKIS
jgi:Flp pilus assembly protein TadD